MSHGPVTGSLEGVVAAEVVVADRLAFDAAVSDERVYTVDLSAAITMTHAQLATHPQINDLYWYVAGWEPLR